MSLKFRGLGLLELIISLVIVAAIILMSTRYYQQATLGNKVSATSGQIKRIIAASMEFAKSCASFNSCPTAKQVYDPISISLLVDNGLLDTQDQNSQWGGLIKVDPGPSAQQILITIANVSYNACNSLNDVLKQQDIGFCSGSDTCKSLTNGYKIYYPSTPGTTCPK